MCVGSDQKDFTILANSRGLENRCILPRKDRSSEVPQLLSRQLMISQQVAGIMFSSAGDGGVDNVIGWVIRAVEVISDRRACRDA